MYVVGLTLMVVSVVAVKPCNRSGKNCKTGKTKKDEHPRCLIYEVTELYVVSLTLLVVSLVAVIPSNHPQPDAIIEIHEAEYKVMEGAGEISIPIQRSGYLKDEVRVVCCTQSVTAQGSSSDVIIIGDDFVSRPDDNHSTIVFNLGEDMKYCMVRIIDDPLYEEDESFMVTLKEPTGGKIGDNNATTVVILADPADEPKFSFSAAEYRVDESVGSLVVMVMRTGSDLSMPASITVRSRQIDPVSAQDGVDYVGVDKILSFSAVVSEQTLDVTVIDDLDQPILEGPKRFLLELKMPMGGSLGETNITTVVIEDTKSDDATKSDATMIEFEDTVYYGEEKDGQMTAVIIRHGDITHDASVRCFTRQNTAIVNVDYIERTNNVVYFAPGQKKADCVVDLIDDKEFEEVESLHLVLGTPTSSTAPVPLVGGNSSTILMINNVEDEPKFSFSAAEYRVDESVGSLVVMVMRTGSDLSKPASITVRSRQIDPVSAQAGVDYVSVDKILSFSALLSFAAVVNEQTLDVAIIDDLGQPILEGPERFLLELKLPMGGSLGETNITTVVIDDTVSDAPVIEFEDTVYYGEEKDGQMTAVIIRHGDITHDASVRCFTRSNTATVNVDYIERTNTDLSVVNFAPGQKKADCIVVIIDDKEFEEVESLQLVLGTPTSSTAPVLLVGGNSSTTLMIKKAEDDVFVRVGHVYLYMTPQKYTCPQGQDVCSSEGGKMAEILSFEEMNYAYSFVTDSVFVGAKLLNDGRYVWNSNGQDIDPGMWAPGEPFGDSCVQLWIRSYGFDDTSPYRYKHVLCERRQP